MNKETNYFKIANFSAKKEGVTFYIKVYIESGWFEWIELKDVCDIYCTLDNVYYFTTWSFEDRTYRFYEFYPQWLEYQEEYIDLENNKGFGEMGISHDFIYSVINGGGVLESTWRN